MKKLYCFDFDGTLTKKDSMFLFLRHCDPDRYLWVWLRYVPLFVWTRLGLLPPQRVKKSFINEFLKDKSRMWLEEKARSFFEVQYPQMIRPSALQFIQDMPPQSTSVIITASMDIWVRPFAEKWGMHLIATQAQWERNIYTGKWNTPNCNGAEKVKRLKTYLRGREYDKIIAFGDTSGDQALLDFSGEGHYRYFH